MSPLWIVLTLLPLLGGAERFNCRGRILGAYYADAKSGCKAFHVCVRVAGGGIRDFRFFCPPGTLFHQEAQTCTDWGDDDPLACPADIYDGYDTKKVSSPVNREEENDFNLQRAETGDRRLAQNNGPVSDLRAAHSSDFFSGQRERGRDDSQGPPASPSSSRQSFRRATTPRTSPTTTQYTTPPPPAPPQYPNPSQYVNSPKRKFVRKRPVYTSTTALPTTFAQSTPRPSTLSQKNFDHVFAPYNKHTTSPANVSPQYKDEYVEVSRVTPKQTKFYPNNESPAPFAQVNEPKKKEGLVELYNYETQSTPGINVQNDIRPFKVRNSFNVSPLVPNENSRPAKDLSTTVDYNTLTSRVITPSTPVFRHFNSVSYEPEKNNLVSFSGAKQNYFNNPTTTPSTTAPYTTLRPDPPLNLNTVAYNTNIGFNAQTSNFAESEEDDGQYRPPQGEDDGQYRPELYERELLSGAHSLNIAASGNRLPDNQKTKSKTQLPPKQTAAPRTFRPSPIPSLPSTQTSRVPEPTYTTTVKLQTVNTQRTFDYFQTYTTTSRPSVSPSNVPVKATTNSNTKAGEARSKSSAHVVPTFAPAAAPRPTTRPPQFAKAIKNKEDASYDYAYYDSDPGFTEYDHIEEFGKTKRKA